MISIMRRRSLGVGSLRASQFAPGETRRLARDRHFRAWRRTSSAAPPSGRACRCSAACRPRRKFRAWTSPRTGWVGHQHLNQGLRLSELAHGVLPTVFGREEQQGVADENSDRPRLLDGCERSGWSLSLRTRASVACVAISEVGPRPPPGSADCGRGRPCRPQALAGAKANQARSTY